MPRRAFNDVSQNLANASIGGRMVEIVDKDRAVVAFDRAGKPRRDMRHFAGDTDI